MSKTENSLSIHAKSERVKPHVLDFSRRPLIMGILNVTPDSFSDGGIYNETEKATRRALTMIDEGADIIDIGGESTRPGAGSVTAQQELDRVMPIIERLAGEIDIPISIDTRKAEVAELACRAGASIINDISGLAADERLADIAHAYIDAHAGDSGDYAIAFGL
jgi:dihydropteroate synthase